jgi:hypothetical protein
MPILASRKRYAAPGISRRDAKVTTQSAWRVEAELRRAARPRAKAIARRIEAFTATRAAIER